MGFKKLIKNRKSTVLFSDKTVTDEQINTILKAVQWAPSSRNQQPWQYVIVRMEDEKAFQLILNTLTPGNIEWAQFAPVFIISLAEMISPYNQAYNRYAWHDVGIANGNMMSQITDLGLCTHPMGGFDKQKITNILELNENIEPVCIFPVGYKEEEDFSKFSENLLNRESRKRERKELNTFIRYFKG